MISLIEFLTISSVATLTVAGVSQVFIRLRQSRRILPESSTRPRCDRKSGLPAAGTWHNPRYGKRARVNCRLEYPIEDHRYEGMLVDMSRQGCRARGRQAVDFFSRRSSGRTEMQSAHLGHCRDQALDGFRDSRAGQMGRALASGPNVGRMLNLPHILTEPAD